MAENLYLVAYDIGHPRRWRRVFKLLHGYGDWLQLSVFQCRLSRQRQTSLCERLSRLIDPAADRVLVVDLGPADHVIPHITCLGAPYQPIEQGPRIL